MVVPGVFTQKKKIHMQMKLNQKQNKKNDGKFCTQNRHQIIEQMCSGIALV